MTDLDALRSALRGSPEEERGSVDLGAIMSSGRRIRTRRRLVRGGGIVGGTAALLVAIVAVGQSGVSAPPEPTVAVTAASPADPSSSPVGAVVMTGFDDEVLYFVAGYHPPRYDKEDPGPTPAKKWPDGYMEGGTGYGLTLGTTGVGTIIPLLTTGADGHWTGFHALTTREDGATRLYGYYEGPVKRIVLEMDDKEIATARTEKWSADGNTTIFWFAPGEFPSGLNSFRLLAYDENDELLPFQVFACEMLALSAVANPTHSR